MVGRPCHNWGILPTPAKPRYRGKGRILARSGLQERAAALTDACQRFGNGRWQGGLFCPRSQTLFGNARSRNSVSRLPPTAKQSFAEVRSQTEFGNEGKDATPQAAERCKTASG